MRTRWSVGSCGVVLVMLVLAMGPTVGSVEVQAPRRTPVHWRRRSTG